MRDPDNQVSSLTMLSALRQKDSTLRAGWRKRKVGRPARRSSAPRTTGIGSFYTHEIIVLANGKKVRVPASNPPARFGQRR